MGSLWMIVKEGLVQLYFFCSDDDDDGDGLPDKADDDDDGDGVPDHLESKYSLCKRRGR